MNIIRFKKGTHFEIPHVVLFIYCKSFTVDIDIFVIYKRRCLNYKHYRVYFRDHIFDERRGSKGKQGKISKFIEKPRGVQPVRFHYKVDETKILPSVRLGITEETLKDCIG